MLRTTLLHRYHFGFAVHGVGVQSEALYSMALEFKAKLCTAVTKRSEELQYTHYVTAVQSFALNSNVPTMRYFKNNQFNPHF
jgi:hypothetical protein